MIYYFVYLFCFPFMVKLVFRATVAHSAAVSVDRMLQGARECCSLTSSLWLKEVLTCKFLKMHGNSNGNAINRYLIG